MENLRILTALDEGDERFDARNDAAMRALAEAEDRHFWHASRNRFIEDRLTALGVRAGARLLELGCGGGCVAAHLSDVGYDVIGVEGHASLARRAAARAPRAQFLVHDLSQGIEAIGQREVDVVGLFDVIEHLDDPKKALADSLGACRRGGLVVGTVPALRSLWSVIDEVSGHRLRYEHDQLLALCKDVPGARVREVVSFNRALVPLMWVQRHTMKHRAQVSESNLAVPFAPFNRALYLLARAEHRASRLLDRTGLAGSSLWFALEKVQEEAP